MRMRTMPELTPGQEAERAMAEERRRRAAEDLAELLESAGWREVLRPGLQRRAERLKERIALDTGSPLEDLRRLQGEYRSLVAVIHLDLKDLDGLL